MNWEYISGFFDADGSITLVSQGKGREKSPQVSFHNNEANILEDIRDFIKMELNIDGFISKKKKAKDYHNQAFDLKYVNFPKCIAIGNKMNLKHQKKNHRFEIIKKIKDYTPRNGKYNQETLLKRKSFENQFFNIYTNER